MLRKATATDEAAIRKCAEAAYGPYIAVIGKAPAPMIADFGAQISNGWVHVAENDSDAIEGFIVFYPRQEHMHLENVAVDPSAAGKGIGKALISLCEREAQRLKLRSIELYTNEKMVANLSIYQHLGFVETGRRMESGFYRVYFEKRLS